MIINYVVLYDTIIPFCVLSLTLFHEPSEKWFHIHTKHDLEVLNLSAGDGETEAKHNMSGVELVLKSRCPENTGISVKSCLVYIFY